MNKGDLITILLLIAILFTVFDIGGDVFFQTDGLKFIGSAGTFIFLLIVIIFLRQGRHNRDIV